MMMDTRTRSSAAWFAGFCLLLPILTGCAVLRNFPHNYMCARNGGSECNRSCPPNCNHGEYIVEAATPPEPIDAVPAAHWEEISDVRAQLDALVEKDASLYKQMAILDENAEKQRLEKEQGLQDVRDLETQVIRMRREFDYHKSNLEDMESSLIEQRQKHDQVLASVEKQLIDVLREYQLE